MNRQKRTLMAIALIVSGCLLLNPGCQPTEQTFRPVVKGFQVAEPASEFGPHGGHRVVLDQAPFSAEVEFDEETRQLVVYLLDSDDKSHVQPVEDLKIKIQVPFPPLELPFQKAKSKAADSATYRTAAESVPAGITNDEDLQGELSVRVGSVTYQGVIRHDHQHLSGISGSDSNRNSESERQIAKDVIVLTVTYCVLIVTGSLFGGWLPNLVRLTHTRMQVMMSLVGGLMLGIGLFHMLPHAVAELGSLDRCIWWMMMGVLVMFFLIRTFHFHQHGPVEMPVEEGSTANHDHDHHHAHGHHNHHHHEHDVGSHELSWVGVALGLSLHTAIDGLALGASIQSDASHGALWSLYGLGTFLAIVLHKPLDAVSITTLMASSGWSNRARNAVNLGFSLMCPLGAGLFLLGANQFTASQHVVVGCALAFAAGVFLVISLGDLLPELEFHSHDRVKLTCALILGVLLAYGIRFLEPEHSHNHSSQTQGSHHQNANATVPEP